MVRTFFVSLLAISLSTSAFAQMDDRKAAREAAVQELVTELRKMSAEDRQKLIDQELKALEGLSTQIAAAEASLNEAQEAAKKSGEKYVPVKIPTAILALGGLVLAGYGGDHLLGRAKMVVNDFGKPIPKIGKVGSVGFIAVGLIMMGTAFYLANGPRSEVVVAVEKVDGIKATLFELQLRAAAEAEYLKILKSI